MEWWITHAERLGLFDLLMKIKINPHLKPSVFPLQTLTLTVDRTLGFSEQAYMLAFFSSDFSTFFPYCGLESYNFSSPLIAYLTCSKSPHMWILMLSLAHHAIHDLLSSWWKSHFVPFMQLLILTLIFILCVFICHNSEILWTKFCHVLFFTLS